MVPQREPFLTLFHIISSSPILITKKGFRLIIILSNYHQCPVPFKTLSRHFSCLHIILTGKYFKVQTVSCKNIPSIGFINRGITKSWDKLSKNDLDQIRQPISCLRFADKLSWTAVVSRVVFSTNKFAILWIIYSLFSVTLNKRLKLAEYLQQVITPSKPFSTINIHSIHT